MSAARHEQVIVVRDPFDAVADRLIRTAHEALGLRTVVLYTDPHERLGVAGSVPALVSGAVAAAYVVPRIDADEVARELAHRFDVAAVVPQGEPQVLDALALADLLGVAWSDPAVVRRFRDKAGLKAHLREQPGGPRVNDAVLVGSSDDVRRARRQGCFERFVLKPNDGTGNHGIGFFGSSTTDEQVAEHLAASGGTALMEEFLDGQEYCVNGQVDDQGRARTYSVQRTVHTRANGRRQLASAFQFVPRAGEEFGRLSAYAESVVTASGLRRSPFHMELIVDEAGPCLVECGARLAGAGLSWLTTYAHGGAVDVLEVALAGYAGRAPHRPQEPDWATYDRRRVRVVCGVHDREERAIRIEGVDAVEAMPEFVDWVQPLHLGQHVHATRDLFQAPWIAAFTADDESLVEAAEARARRLVRINPRAAPPVEAARAARATVQRLGHHAVGLPELMTVHPESLVGGGNGMGVRRIRPVRGAHDLTSRAVARVGSLSVVRSTFEQSTLTAPLLHRYMGGSTEDEVVTRVGELLDDRLLATMHLRLPRLVDAEGAERYLDGYESLVRRLVAEGIQQGQEISVKIEQLGYQSPGGLDLVRANLDRLAGTCYGAGMRLTIDMEGVEEVDDTLLALDHVRERHPDVGVALQANLVRTEDDCRALAAPGSRVRLVKGGYHVDGAAGLPRRAEVDRAYVRCLGVLMQGEGYPMVATHDDRILEIAQELARRRRRTPDDHEFQLLAGVREQRQHDLVAQGETVRAYVAYGPEWFPWLVWIVSEKPSKLLALAKGALTG